MRSSFWVSFGVCALFASVGLIATDALALPSGSMRGFSANACVPLSTADHVVGDRSIDGQFVNYDPSHLLVAACPVVNDQYWGGSAGAEAFTPWSTRNANDAHMYVWSGGVDGVKLSACRTYYTGGGGTCGTVESKAPDLGVYDLAIDPSSVWASANRNDGFYLKASVASNSAIFSYSFGRNP